MMSTARIEAVIKQDEGLRLKPYVDTTGNYTIGYGHNLSVPIPIEAAEIIFQHDLAIAVLSVERLGAWTAHLDEVRRSALVAMAFQLGEGTLRTFRVTLDAFKRGDYAKAGGHMLASEWAKQTPERAKRTAAMVVTGHWE